MAKILVTGSTGFIGKRLISHLLRQGHTIYGLSRIKGLKSFDDPHFHTLYGDMRDPASLEAFPQEIDVAYYLIHSMANSGENLIKIEGETARHFVSAIEKTACKQIVFLGGIIEDEERLSPHLRSRLVVEKVLRAGRIPCTILRSSIIIGAGSASFEIIRDLVEKLPFMVAPKWVRSLCQPISIDDVLFYLDGVLGNTSCFGQIYDIGGPEVISFKEVLLRYARFRKLKRYILDIPLLTPRLSSYWLVLITSVPFSICRYLVESMKHNTRKLNTTIDSLLPHSCLPYEEALTLAFQKIAQNEVLSTWMDDWNLKKINPDIQDFIKVPQEGCLKDIQIVPFQIPVDEIQKRIWSIGGEKGWYSMNWAWKLRGFIDELVGGKGLNRGRRDPNELHVGESVDFWRVILADKRKKHVILYAEMKLPGEAWLEFEIDEAKKVLKQTATFRPKGVWGRMYWYGSLPFHLIIFKNMAKRIASKSL